MNSKAKINVTFLGTLFFIFITCFFIINSGEFQYALIINTLKKSPHCYPTVILLLFSLLHTVILLLFFLLIHCYFWDIFCKKSGKNLYLFHPTALYKLETGSIKPPSKQLKLCVNYFIY